MERKMLGVEPIEIYVGGQGHICLRQESMYGHDDSVIALVPLQIPTVIKWLNECLEELGNMDFSDEESERNPFLPRKATKNDVNTKEMLEVSAD